MSKRKGNKETKKIKKSAEDEAKQKKKDPKRYDGLENK